MSVACIFCGYKHAFAVCSKTSLKLGGGKETVKENEERASTRMRGRLPYLLIVGFRQVPKDVDKVNCPRFFVCLL